MAGKTRFLVLGGYLGAGKTTLAVNLAKRLRMRHDMSVSMITNDQGDVLVDTEFTKDSGFDVREILGGCFCTNFDAFVSSARTLVSSGRPDVIIAEPIGTSTNIMSSVVAPLRSLYPDEFSVAPFAVVVDCVRAMDILSKSKKTAETVDLIPAHQITEAEVIVLSKTDMADPDKLGEIENAVKKIVPCASVVRTSSSDEDSTDDLINIILSDKLSERLPNRADNRQFAFEKAKLGWYSGTYSITPSGRTDMYSLCTDLMKGVASEYGIASVVHVKVIVSSEEAAAKMSLVGANMQVDGIRGSRFIASPGKLVLNARIISPPKKLETVMHTILGSVPEKYDLTLKKESESCFSPKPESPSHFFFE